MRSFRKPITFFAAVLMAFCLATPVVNANSLKPMVPVGPENVSSCNSGKPHDLVLLIDQSFSLNEEIEKGQTKQEKLIEALLNLNSQLFEKADGQENDLNSRNNVGIIQFAAKVEVLRDMNDGPLQSGEFQKIVDQLNRNSGSLQGGTNYLDAFDAAINQLAESKTDDRCQSIVWFTDGELNLDSGSPIEEANRLTNEFCGKPGSSATSTAELLREKNIETYVIFLKKQSELPKRRMKPESAKTDAEKESIRTFDSIESLRAVTGDWNDKVSGQDEKRQAVNSLCGSFADNLGELIFIERSEDLIYQLLVGASDCIATSKSLKMPSARLIKKLVIYFEGTRNSGSLVVSPLSLARNAPPEGSKIVLGVDDLKGLDGAPFPAGWEIQFGADFQTCIGLDWEPDALEIKGTAVQTKYSVLETQPIQINLDLGIFSADVEDISDSEAIVGSTATVSGTNQIEFRPTSNGEIAQLPGQVRLIPKGVDPAVTDKLRTKPILATVKFSESVVVTGAEDVPVLKCGEESGSNGEDLKLSFRHVDGELSDDILTSGEQCEITNLKTGVVEIKWKNQPKARLSENGQWNFRSGDQVANQSLKFDSAEGDTQNFNLAYSEAVDGSYIPQSDQSAALEVRWLNNGATLITWKINVEIDVDLKKPANRIKATFFALLISLIAGLLSYLLLYFILWKTAIVGKSGQVRYRVERRIVGKYFSSKDIEIDSSIVSSLKPTNGDNLGRSLTAGGVQLNVKVAPIFRPLRVLRGAWSEVLLSNENISVRPRGPEPSSTNAPLRPAVIARLVSFQVESDKYEIEYTFLLPNGNADLAALVNAQRDATKEVIDRAGSPSITQERPTRQQVKSTLLADGEQTRTQVPLPPLPVKTDDRFNKGS
jgi:hypothetical protein